MPITVANTALTNNVDYMRNRLNEIAHAMSNKVVTVDSNTATGNAAITGTFTANIFAGMLRTATGTTNVHANTTHLIIQSPTIAVAINSSSVAIGNATSNVVITSSGISVNGTAIGVNATPTSVTTVGTSTQLIDSFLKTSFRSGEYIASIKNNSANGYQVSKFLVTHSDGNAFITEYGGAFSNTDLGVFSAAVNTTHVLVNFTPVPGNATIKFFRQMIEV